MVDTGGAEENRRGRAVPWLSGQQPSSSGEDQSGTLGAKWRPRTRQQEGRQSEKQVAKGLGAKVHPNSGALRIKHDASDAETLYELKDANKTYTLKAEELHTLWTRAVHEGKEPVFIITFKDRGLRATITITKEVFGAK